MILFKSFSGKILVLLAFVFALSSIKKMQSLSENDNRCIALADGFGYYMYLPHLFENGSLNITKEWAQEKQNIYCNGFPAYQLKKQDNGSELNIYQMGQSYLFLPAYTVAEIFARTLKYKTDGFSTPYHIAFILNALLFLIIGLIYTRKLLLLFASDKATGWTLLLIFLATNTYATFTIQYDLPHLYLYTLNAVFLFHVFTYLKEPNKKNLLYSAIVLGLASCMRPTEVFLGIIPLFILFKTHGRSLTFLKKLSIYPLFGIIWMLPQIYYWNTVGDQFLALNMHSEDIVYSDPHLIDFLFSYRKGWLLYTPLFIIVPINLQFSYFKNKTLFYSTTLFFLIYLYTVASWETWYYAASFGSRPMVEIYPVLAIGIALLITNLKGRLWRSALLIFSLFCLSLNLFQSRQMEIGILHNERMTKEHYWYIFGQLNIEKYDKSRLLMDRADINWIDAQRADLSTHRSIRTSKVFALKTPYIGKEGEYCNIADITPLQLLETDEALLEIRLKCKTSDSLASVNIQLDTYSPYNIYSWIGHEISKGYSQTSISEIQFKANLPEIRHHDDQILIYLHKPENVTIEITELEIVAHQLIRK